MKVEVWINEEPKGHRVRVGDRYEDNLTTEEALYAVACMIVTGSDESAPYMRTKAEHDRGDAAKKEG